MRDFKLNIREKDNDDKSLMTFIIKKLLHRNNLISIVYDGNIIKIANEKNIHKVFNKIEFYGDNIKNFQLFDKLGERDFYDYFMLEEDYKSSMKRHKEFWSKELKLNESDIRKQEYAFNIHSNIKPTEIIEYTFGIKINDEIYTPKILYKRNYDIPFEDKDIYSGLILGENNIIMY